MNIFGNALKYTQKGSIVVKVSLHDVENTVHDGTETRTLELKITDTGKGISSEYLRTSLFNRELGSELSTLLYTFTKHLQRSARKIR